MNSTMNDDNNQDYYNDSGTDYYNDSGTSYITLMIFTMIGVSILFTIFRVFVWIRSKNNNTNRNVSQSDAVVGGNNDIELGGGRTEVSGGRWGIGGFFGGGDSGGGGGGFFGGGGWRRGGGGRRWRWRWRWR
jgi:hypothetical protein